MRDLMSDEDKTVFMPAVEPEVAAAKPSTITFGGLSNITARTGFPQKQNTLNIKPIAAATAGDQNILSALQLEYRCGINVLVEYGTELFFAHYQIIKDRFTDAEKIRSFIQDALLKFEMRAQQGSLPKTLVKSAKYVLCTFIDETVLQTD